jgi:hypothetical protein
LEVFLTRAFLFTLLPVALGAAVAGFDASARGRLRQAEAMLIPLFIIGVAGSGFGGFVAHVFISDEVAESIGWEAGSPFQLEVGFANLAIGLLGAIAAERRDGFREATVIAATVFAVGATFVHVRDILDSGNLAPGNTIQNVPNLFRPALLIFFLRLSRRAGPPSGDGRAFDAWRAPILRASVVCVVIASTAFTVGFATNQSAFLAAFATPVAAAGFGLSIHLSRRPASAR